MSGDAGPYEDHGGGGISQKPAPVPGLSVNPHHFALHAIESAFSSAAGLRAAAAAVGLQPEQQFGSLHQEHLPHIDQQFHDPSHHHQGPPIEHHQSPLEQKFNPDANQSNRDILGISPVLPLDVQLNEGQQQNQIDPLCYDPLVETGDQGINVGMIKKEMPTEPDEVIESPSETRLRQAVSEVGDASVIWKIVRSRILGHCQLWDLLLDKACLRYYSSDEQETQADKNAKKFHLVVSEMQSLLGEFKCLMDGCLIPEKSFKTDQNTPRNDQDSKSEVVVSLGAELARAYSQTDDKHKLEPPEEINSLYQHFFDDREKDRRDAGLMYNTFMPFGKTEVCWEEDWDKDNKKSDKDPSLFPYECQTCQRRYKHANNLERHESVCKGEPIVENSQWKKTLEGKYYCTFPGCGDSEREYESVQFVQAHFNSTHAKPGELSFPCDFCEIKFTSKNLLNYHRKIKHSIRYPCNQCGKEFASQSVLERHTQVHLGTPIDEAEEKPFKCDMCDYCSTTSNGLTLHQRSAHNDARRDGNKLAYSCDQCTRRYKSTKNLLRHQKNCSGVPPPNVKPTWRKDASDGRYYCTFEGCTTNKNWTCSSGVWKHYNTEHADVADPGYCVYPCDLCDERFPTKTMCNQHRKHKHLALFQFTCTVCGKRLPSTLRLKLHMRLHTGEKPYKCELCDYRSATKSAVNQHKMRMHEEHSHIALQRHVCEICGKSFKVKSNLKEHIRSHSDARTFLCGFCGKALKNRQCLNRHLFTHGVKYTCQNCGKNFANPSSLHVHRRDKHGVVQ